MFAQATCMMYCAQMLPMWLYDDVCTGVWHRACIDRLWAEECKPKPKTPFSSSPAVVLEATVSVDTETMLRSLEDL